MPHKDTAFIDQTLKNVGFKRNTRSRKLVKKLLYTAQNHLNYMFSSGRWEFFTQGIMGSEI